MANNDGKNGNHNYAAGAGIVTADDDSLMTLTDGATQARERQGSGAEKDESLKVGEALDVKTAEGKRRPARTGLKITAFVGGLILLIALGLFWFMSSDGPGKRPVKTSVPAGKGKDAEQSDEKLTAEAIARARSQVAPSPTPQPVTGSQQSAPAIIVQQTEPVVPVKVGTTTMNANADPDAARSGVAVRPADGVAGTVNANANTGAANSRSLGSSSVARTPAGPSTARQPSKASGQKALIYGEDEAPSEVPDQGNKEGSQSQSRPVNAGYVIGTAGAGRALSTFLAPRPAFGSLLPVRTLGAIYTLRTGALIRMELTRDVGGTGWKLPRRTVIVGTLRGGEYDRAYVTVIGYIDPASGRLVKFGGSLLGSDAGEGIKGQRRQVTGRWSRILGEISDKGFSLAQAMLGRRGGTTIVLGDAGRPEIDGLTRNGDRREFIEVKAGAMGYVSVTELPSDVEGVDTLSEMSRDELSRLLDSGTNTSTGLSDDEVARLISSGSRTEIRAALPRMNDAMRRIAEQVISQSER
jgi:hypothetical protein